jgi:hypothetical protein
VISWFARDFGDSDAVRGVLIGSTVGHAVFVVLGVYAGLSRLFNGLILGEDRPCLSVGALLD